MDMSQMMQQVGQLQQKLAEAQEQARQLTVEASAGGGMVTVVVSGGLEVRSVKIDPAAIDPKDPGMLQDLIAAAVNQGIVKAQALVQETVQKAMGPLAAMLPPGMF
jgi:DNA-binding YbaB/EbfC family protein